MLLVAGAGLCNVREIAIGAVVVRLLGGFPLFFVSIKKSILLSRSSVTGDVISGTILFVF